MNRAILKIGRHEYEVLHMNYKFDRNIDHRGCPISRYYGGSIYVHIETTDDRLLFQTMFDEKMPTVDGSIEVYGFNDAVVRRIEFEGAYIYDLTEQMSVYSPWLPMLTTIGISPMRLTFNNRIAIDRRWPDYPWGWDPVKKEDVKYAQVKEIETEVSEIEMVTPLTKTEYCENPGMDLHKEYKLRVKSYTNGKPRDTNRIRWEYSYVNIKGEMVTGAFKEQRGEELIFLFNDAAAVGNVISFFAYISTPKGEGKCQIYANPLWRYKGTKQWGELQTEPRVRSGHHWTLEEIYENCTKLDVPGKTRAAVLNKCNEAMVKNMYEGFGMQHIGTRTVLSDNDNIEQRVIDNFYHGTESKMSFDETTVFSQKLRVNPTFQEYWNRYLTDFIKETIINRNIETITEREIKKLLGEPKISSKPQFSVKSEIPSYDYYGLMGGTQTVKIDLDIIQTEESTYVVKTRMYIGDVYGADEDDINGISNIKGYAECLNAFFWLQYHYGCHPFETEIIYSSVDVLHNIERKEPTK